MAKLKRAPIISKSVNIDSVIEFPKLEINIQDKYYDLSEFGSLENSTNIVSGLKQYLRGKRSAKQQLLVLIVFLRGISTKIDEKSMLMYKKNIDADATITLSTKSQKYSAACAFVRFLFSLEILDEFDIPLNFKNMGVESIPTFGDIARNYIEKDSNFNELDIKNIADNLSLEFLDAKVLSYCLSAIDIIQNKAIDDIQKWEKDWDKVSGLIENLDEFRLRELSKVIDFNATFPVKERTVEEALQILYSKFGKSIPAVKYWPRGMEDFFRSKNWKSSRVKNLFEGIESHAGDMEVFNSAISSMSVELHKEYQELEDYYFHSQYLDSRTIESAFSILFAKFGRILPTSNEWPRGITDYLKYRGWNQNRTRAAFFPHPDTLAPFIVGLLSHIELAPNVDSVAFYCYLDSFQIGIKKGKIEIFLDKYRGKSLRRQIDETDPMITLCKRHTDRMLKVLNSIDRENVNNFLDQERIPLFLQYTPHNGLNIRTLDKSTVVGLVKRYLANLAKENSIILPLVKGECTGRNFRPTITAIHRLSGKSLLSIRKLLNHSSLSTTLIYTERAHTKSVLFNKAKAFQQYLVENSKKNIYRVEVNTQNQEMIEPVDQWINCDAKRIWFKDQDVISEWISWERKICESEIELKFDNPERWEKFWLPRLVKYQSLLSNVLEIDKKNASKVAEHIKLPPLS